MATMATGQLLELLTGQIVVSSDAPPAKKRHTKEDEESVVPWQLDQLWEQSQYDEAFDLGAFIKSMR